MHYIGNIHSNVSTYVEYTIYLGKEMEVVYHGNGRNLSYITGGRQRGLKKVPRQWIVTR